MLQCRSVFVHCNNIDINSFNIYDMRSLDFICIEIIVLNCGLYDFFFYYGIFIGKKI